MNISMVKVGILQKITRLNTNLSRNKLILKLYQNQQNPNVFSVAECYQDQEMTVFIICNNMPTVTTQDNTIETVKTKIYDKELYMKPMTITLQSRDNIVSANRL